MRARAEKQKVPRRVWLGVDGVARGFQRMHQVLAVVRQQRLLHLVDDQHHVGFNRGHQLHERLRQGGATWRPYAVDLEPEREARCADVGTLQTTEQHRARRLQLPECSPHGLVNERRRTFGHVGPQIDIDNDRTTRLQRGDQVLAQEGGFANTPYAREKNARAHTLQQGTGLQQLRGQGLGVAGPMKQVVVGHREPHLCRLTNYADWLIFRKRIPAQTAR